MPYRPGNPFIDERFGAITSSLLPASIASGFIGTCALVLAVLAMSLFRYPSAFQSVDEILLMLVGLGAAIAIGTIAGTFIVAFYLLAFGWPVAFLLGERIRGPIGLGSTIFAATIAFLFALYWTWNWSFFGGSPLNLEALFPVAAFAVPASFLYRRFVISALDEAAIV